MKFNNIQEIRAHEFVGNYGSDAKAFNAIVLFVEDKSNSMEDRASAIFVMVVFGMGMTMSQACPGATTDEAIVAKFLED